MSDHYITLPIVPVGFGITDTVHNKPSTYTAFGSLKVAGETILGDYRFDLDTFEDLFDIEYLGQGNFQIEEGGTGARISTGASANSSVIVLSKETHYYQAGRGLMYKSSMITGDSGIAGNIREWGLTCSDDILNGVMLRLNGTVLSFVILRNGVETEITSDNWDIPQTHDGNGSIYYIQLEWLGTGNIFLYKNELLVFEYHFIGTSTEFSIGTPDLKLYYKNENTTNATNVYMKFGCASVISEGGNSAIRMEKNPSHRDLGILTKSVITGHGDELDHEYNSVHVNSDGELLTIARMNLIQFGKIKELLEINNEILAKMTKQLEHLTDFDGEE